MSDFDLKKIEKYVKKVQEKDKKEYQIPRLPNCFTVNALLSLFDKNHDGVVSKKEFNNITAEKYSIFTKELNKYNQKNNETNEKIYNYEELKNFLDDGYINSRELSEKSQKYLNKTKNFPEEKSIKNNEIMTKDEIKTELQSYEIDDETIKSILEQDLKKAQFTLFKIRREKNDIDKNSNIVDGHIGTFSQGHNNNCTLLSLINDLSDEELKNICSKKQDKNGKTHYIVNFPEDNGKKPIKITQDEIDNKSIKYKNKEILGFSTGDNDMTLLEMAYIKRYGLNMKKYGERPPTVLERFQNPKNNNTPTNYYDSIDENMLLDDTHKEIMLTDRDYLKQNKHFFAKNFALKNGITINLTTEQNRGQRDIAEFSNGITLWGEHAYSVKSYNPKTKEVTLVDPAENSTDIIVPFDALYLFTLSK